MKKGKLNRNQLAYLKEKLKPIEDLFLSIAIGNYNLNFEFPKEEDEFTGLYTGIKLMLDSSQEKLDELKNLNQQLKNISKKKGVLLEELQEISHIGSWEWNITNDTISCSNEVLKIFGIKSKKEKLSYDSLLKLTHPQDVKIVDYIFRKAFYDHNPFKIHQRIVLKEDHIKFIEIRGAVEVNKKDHPLKMYGTIQDISTIKATKEKLFLAKQQLEAKVDERTRDLKRAYRNLEKEMALKEQSLLKEKELATIVESSSDAIISKTLDGYIKIWNLGATKMYGYSADEMIGNHISKLIPEYKLQEYYDSMDKIAGGQPVAAFQTVRKTKDGTLINVSVSLSCIKDNLGNVIGASAIAIDITERKKIEYELKQSEEKYRTLVETMNEGVLIVDNDNTILFSNDFMCKILGYELNEILGKNTFNFIADETDKKEMSQVIKTLKKGEPSKYEIQLLTKNKQKLWLLVSSSPTYDNHGKIIGSVSLHTNITNRKLMEEELNSIANIPEENPNPTFRFSVHGQVLMYANPASSATLNFFDNEDNKDIRQEWIKEINKVYQLGTPIKKELPVKNQTYMCTIVPVPENGYVNVYAVDITATKEAEAEIRKLSLVLSKTENAVFIADKNGVIQWVNEGFRKITGYSMEEVIGTTGEQLRKGRKTGLNRNHPYFNKMLTTKQSVSYESHNFKKNGKEYWAITTLTPVFDNNQNLESIIAIDTDITYKKQAEKEILKAKKIAEESAKAKELFLANMSHEIRTPMNAIMGIIQLLKDTRLNKTQLEYLKSMDFAGENLLRIINDVLDLAKIESGKMSIEKIPFNLNELIKDLFSSLHHRVNEKDIRLIKVIDKNVPNEIIGDPVRLNQILINLISNAIKFTKEGFIKLHVAATNTTNNTVNVKFQIKDTGIGIHKDMHTVIFSDFEQANKETTRKYGGTGLGLSIVKRLLTLQDGSITLESTEGEGSTFTFEIPYTISSLKDASKTTHTFSDSDNNLLINQKALLIEDNILNQMVATKFLESMGLKIDIANNGLEGIDTLAKKSYDIILMDIQMPKMDGYTAASYIRTKMKGKKSQIPILAMTAHAISGEKEKCINVGMNDYITKPLKREHLKMKIINLLKK
ncbi:MAG: PAS domain S-box protein [Flavobacteriales bacterium]|nr:PAS domain S-box protein [Flavobacteriales bacterium]